MAFEKINIIIERNRRLNEISSFPFAVRNGDKVHIRWFNYIILQDDEILRMFIGTVLCADENMNVIRKKTDITIETEIGNLEEPEIDEGEYLSRLEGLLTDFDEEKMDELLKKAELEPLLIAYKKISEINLLEE